MKVIWLAWERHRRTLGLCYYLGITPTIFESTLPRIVKYPYLICKSWFLIRRKKPRILVVQNPSIVLTLLACFLKRLYKFRLIIDAHNAGLIPDNYFLQKLKFLYTYFVREADLTVVTNEGLAKLAEQRKGSPFILPDCLPKTPLCQKTRLKGKRNVVYICTFGQDEPFEEVIEAGRILSDNVVIYVTGDLKKAPKNILSETPPNIIFTGYLEEKDYWQLLFSADLILDLTHRENCLVCGAYEAVAIGTPMVLSDKRAIREYFTKGVLYTGNDCKSIQRSILQGLNQIEDMKASLYTFRSELQEESDRRCEVFRAMIGLS